jgi:iron complex outermembrane receptor protein
MPLLRRKRRKPHAATARFKAQGEEMNRRVLRLSVSTAAVIAALCFTSWARAADADPDQASASSTVAPVTISAERRTINLQTAPLAATVLSGEQLQQQAVYDIDQLQFTTPSLTVTNYGLGEDFNIRGIGKTETNVQTPSGVVVYRDGVATFPGFFTTEPYFDIASVEVLRGPQGTFAGQNASGGAVFINENNPTFGPVNGSIEGQSGNHGDARLRFAWNIPLSDTLAIRFAAQGEREDSFFHFAQPQIGHPGRLEQASARVSVLWEPNASWRFLLKNDFTYYNTGGLPSSPVLIPAGPAFPRYAENANLFNVSENAPRNIATFAFDRTVFNVAYTFGGGFVARSITGYQTGRGQYEYDIDGNAVTGNYFSVIAYERTFSEEVNIVSPDTGPLRWVVGGYYQHDWVHLPFGRVGFDIATPPLEILLDYTTPKITEAGFGQVSWDITEQWQIVGGARFTHSNFILKDRTALLLFGNPFGVDEVVNTHQGDDKVTGKVSLNFKLDPSNFFYVFAATGHKPGGINTTPVPFDSGTPEQPFKPENQTNFEIGWKPTLMDGHLRGQLDGFYTRYTGYQLTFGTSISGIGAPGQQVIRNVPGTTVIYGVEAQAQAVFGDWSFDANADWLHTRLGSTPGGCPGTPATVSPSCVSGPLGVENIGGREQPYSPQWSVSGGGQYVWRMEDGSKVTPRVDVAYISSQWSSVFYGTPEGAYAFHLRPIFALNAQLTWERDKYRVSLYGTNLTNGRYFYENTAIPPLRYASPPIQFGVRASRTF